MSPLKPAIAMRKLPYCVVLLLCLGMFHLPLNCFGQSVDEICENGRDDDRDGLIDLNDPDCACAVIQPKSLIPNPSFEEFSCCPKPVVSSIVLKPGSRLPKPPPIIYTPAVGWVGTICPFLSPSPMATP